jgi:hypothetical protein
MPRVCLKTILAGPVFTAQPGECVDVSDEQAAQLVDAGFADIVGPKTPEPGTAHEDGEKYQAAQAAETATVAPSETATAGPQRKKAPKD